MFLSKMVDCHFIFKNNAFMDALDNSVAVMSQLFQQYNKFLQTLEAVFAMQSGFARFNH